MFDIIFKNYKFSTLIEQYLEELKIDILNHVEIILLTSWF